MGQDSPQEGHEGSRDPLRERWQNAVREAREQRGALRGVINPAQETRQAVQETLEPPRTYQHFCIGQQIVMHGESNGVMSLTCDGNNYSILLALEGVYPANLYDVIVGEGGTSFDVRKKNGDRVALARRDPTPQFLRAVLVYNQELEGGSLVREAGFSSQGVMTRLCAHPDRIVARSGGREYSVVQYLRAFHRLRAVEGDGGLQVSAGRERAHIITDPTIIEKLATLHPLARRASRGDLEACRQLRAHLQRMGLPLEAYCSILEEFFGYQISVGNLSLLADNIPTRNVTFRTTSDALLEQLVPKEKLALLHQSGLLISVPESISARQTTVRADFQQEAQGTMQITIRCGAETIDLNREFLAGRNIHFCHGNAYQLTGMNYSELHVPESQFHNDIGSGIAAIFHELGHADDLNPENFERHRMCRSLFRNQARILRDHTNAPITDPRHPAVVEYMRLQRQLVMHILREEGNAWQNSLRYWRTPAGRRLFRGLRQREFSSYTRFREDFLSAYRTYIIRDPQGARSHMEREWSHFGRITRMNVVQSLPGMRAHFGEYAQFADRMFHFHFYHIEEEMKFLWAEEDIEAIKKLDGPARARAIKDFNFQYGSFASRAFRDFHEYANDGRVLAFGPNGELQAFWSRQAFERAKSQSTTRLIDAPTEIGQKRAATSYDILTHLISFQTLRGEEKDFDVTTQRLDAAERALMGAHPSMMSERHLTMLRNVFTGAGFSEQDVELVIREGWFGYETADYARLHPRGSQTTMRAIEAAVILDSVRSSRGRPSTREFDLPASPLQRTIAELAQLASRLPERPSPNSSINRTERLNQMAEEYWQRQRAALEEAVALGAGVTSANVGDTFTNIRAILSREFPIPNGDGSENTPIALFNDAQIHLLMTEGCFDPFVTNGAGRPLLLATRARNFGYDVRSLQPFQRIWFRGGLDTLTTDQIVEVAVRMNLDANPQNARARVQEQVNTIIGRR